MHKIFLILATALGALSVALGAFAAHGLKRVADEQTVSIFHTGVEYQFYHTFGLLAAGILYAQFPSVWTVRAGWFFVIGIVLFSGSLYLMTALKVNGGSIGPAGIITPIGGLFFIAGWVSLLAGVLQKA